MIGGLKQISVVSGKEAEFEKIFNLLKLQVRKNEPGNLYYDLYKSEAKAGSYIVMERYQNAAALDAHKKSSHGAEFFPKIRALLQNIEVEYYKALD